MKKAIKILSLLMVIILLCSCARNKDKDTSEYVAQEPVVVEDTTELEVEITTESIRENETIKWNDSWKYAEFSKIHSDTAILYRSSAEVLKNKVICVNAGHGTKGGSAVKTQCHPDGSPKVTGGSTGKGALSAYAVAEGATMRDGTAEAKVTLKLAKIVKDSLLEAGYDVLMVREDDDAQLDNIARTVMANQYADCHISLHYDSTENDKGLFYIGVPDISSYKSMEPVASLYKDHKVLGEAVVNGERRADVKIFSDGYMNIDLTQTSYSTVPSIDLEVGDIASDYSDEQHQKIANGIVFGLDEYFGFAS